MGGNRFDGLKHLHQYFGICAAVLPDQVKGNVDQPQKTNLGGHYAQLVALVVVVR